MDAIGSRAKELHKVLDEIISNLGKMTEVNYDKNKLDYLFEILEKSMENEEQVTIVLDRLKAIERIHKESPNIELSIDQIVERQALIESSFNAEDL
jgi:K+/H+ antiporter YhaU regulatory subunit KhtT